MPYLPATLRVWWFVSCWHWLQSYVFWQPLPSPRHLKSISKMMHQSPPVKKPVRNLLRARMTDCMTRWGGGAETHPYDDMFFETFLNWLLKVYQNIINITLAYLLVPWFVCILLVFFCKKMHARVCLIWQAFLMSFLSDERLAKPRKQKRRNPKTRTPWEWTSRQLWS